MTATVPTLAEVASRLGKPEAVVSGALSAEVEDQATRCRVVPYTDALAEAIYRRVARNLALRNVPLGVQMNDVGGVRIGSQDPEVRRLEGPYRKVVVG